MNEGKDYASDTDESDEDFRPEDINGESSASEDDAVDSEANEALDEDAEDLKKKRARRKYETKKVNKKKIDSKNEETYDEDLNTSRRTTRQRNDAKTNGKNENIEKDDLVSDEDISHTNALWADFLKDVNHTAILAKVDPSNVENRSSSSNNVKEASEKRNEAQSETSVNLKAEEKKSFVSGVVDFPNEDTIIQRDLDVSSIKENKAATLPAARKQPFSRIMPGVGIKRTVAGSASGLGSVLNQLGKKKKLSVLEKSQMDWTSFKKSEGIDEQLQTFNKGKDGYLERQDFLQRTDLRQFEIEKNLRQTTRRPY